jgi:23S rRNA pseudouridine2605 synthase
VDGKPAVLGQQLSGIEKIAFDGRPIKLARQKGKPTQAHLAYYKPAGELTSRSDPDGRSLVFDSLPAPPQGRWINVGRLDISTSGLLLFTTDGELAHRLMHPRYEISREYAVRLLGSPDADQLRQLTEGVELEDGRAAFDSVQLAGGTGTNIWIHVTLREGRNREVRRIFDALGMTVSRLIRVRYGPVELGKMRRGASRKLEAEETAALYAAVELPAPGSVTAKRAHKARQTKPSARR